MLSNILRVRLLLPIDNKFTINGTLVSRTTVLCALFFSHTYLDKLDNPRNAKARVEGGKAVRRMTAVDLAIPTMRPSATSVIIDR